KKLPADIEAVFEAEIDEEARKAISSNHTATHLLHEALREVLGTHVEQRGSFVSPDVLRFDFSHFQKLTPEEIRRVEHLANSRVRAAIPRDEKRCVSIDKAREMGAMALFGEKYGDEVRVIRYGSSVELCGGTHVDNTGNIGMIKIISESSIAAGIRRIEAVTGARVEDMLDKMQDTLREIGSMFNNVPDLVQALRKSIDENAELKHQAEEYFKERVNVLTNELLAKAREVNGIKVVELTGIRLPEVVKNVAFGVRAKSPEHTVFIGATKDPAEKPLLTLMITEDLVADGMNASTTVREAAKLIQGGGGGQPGFAQAGGKNKDGISAAYEKMHSILGL
ncbi:DHHA1 domain-containing protein, partial [uncultured Muribaculum sp.]